MLNVNHPDDERLSALAGGDPEATEDAALVAHLTSCDRCTELVNELGALRTSLAELPDLQPTRPLRLLPPAEDVPAHDGLVAWVRRLFAPALTAGAALALVGMIGTTGAALQGAASGAGPEAYQADEPVASAEAEGAAGGGGTAAAPGEDAGASASERMSTTDDGAASPGSVVNQLPAERSPWPMVLFTGVALMVAAALLRWIVVPRAG
jgi:anti-sigma factor RsiW